MSCFKTALLTKNAFIKQQQAFASRQSQQRPVYTDSLILPAAVANSRAFYAVRTFYS